MSKLILLISLMGFITINKAFANSEDKIKRDCIAKVGGQIRGHERAYQQCLRSNGLVAVNRNLNSNDNSKSDARICYMGNPICRQCFAPYVNYTEGSSSLVRTKVTQCIQKHEAAEKEKERQADLRREAERKKRLAAANKNQIQKKNSDEIIDGGALKEIVVTATVTCSKGTPRYCKTEQTCLAHNGIWDGTACKRAPCQLGSTEDVESEEGNLCKCDGSSEVVERGTAQVCPSACNAAYNVVFNSATKSCACATGFVDPDGNSMRCVAANQRSPEIEKCLVEFETRVTSCDSTSASAVDKCDPKRQQSSDGSTLGTLQNVLNGVGQMVGGAVQSCGQAAIAGSTGYSTLSGLRDKCDTEITSCKTTCTESSTYITSNVQTVYEQCREASYQDNVCLANSPYNIMSRDLFNADWDRVNKAAFEARVQEMQSKVTSSNAQCETNGTAVANREKMSQFMGDMDTAYKSATQCECQLSSNGSNCNSIVGPADCAADPSLAGCAKATVNCISGSDDSKQCACFRDPRSDACLGIAGANTERVANSNVSGFAAGGANASSLASTASPFAATGSDGTNIGKVTDGLNSEATPFAATSGGATTATDAGSPDGKVGNSGSAGGGTANFGKSDNGNGNGASEESSFKSISGLLSIAKGAFNGVFSNKKKDSAQDGKQYDADGNPVNSVNSGKWRPRGFARGVASDGSDIELAGKFEDIWKVMNKQYKVQDQKDSFIFGGEKK